MKRIGSRILTIAVCIITVEHIVWADTFGTGANQFEIDFVNISGDSGDLGSWPVGEGYTFSGVNHGDYRMGKFEITNDQWDKFQTELAVPVTGNPSNAYDDDPHWTGTNIPTNELSWFEAAQFVNWLNTSTGHQAAYKFTGTQGQNNYTYALWEEGDIGYQSSNPFRNSNAYYFLPTDSEWVKAAYWDGTTLQRYSNASIDDLVLGEPDPAKWNYSNYGGTEPWSVDSGVEELNGTFHMMGNVWEWMENPYSPEQYASDSDRGVRGGSYYNTTGTLASRYRAYNVTDNEAIEIGFRVASVPEPCGLVLFGLGGVVLLKKRIIRR